MYVNVIGYSVGAMSWYTPDIAHAAAHYRCYTGYHALTDTVLCSKGVLSQQRYQTPPIRIKHGAFRWTPYKPELLFYLVFDEYINRSVLLLATEY